MKLFALFVTFLLFLNGFTTAQTLIRDSCKKAAATDPELKLGYCVQSLEGDPQSKTATSIEGLVIASAKTAASKMISVKGIVENILKDKRASRGIEMLLRGCVEFYDVASDSIDEALTSVKSRDYDSAKVSLSAALDAPTDCEDGFMERKQQKSPFAKENDILRQKLMIPLDFANML